MSGLLMLALVLTFFTIREYQRYKAGKEQKPKKIKWSDKHGI